MWFVYASLLFALIAYAVRKYGLNFYRFGRLPFLRRLVGKTRPSTPPLLDERRYSREISNEHSVFQVYDDGTIVASKVERPPPPVIQTKANGSRDRSLTLTNGSRVGDINQRASASGENRIINISIKISIIFVTTALAFIKISHVQLSNSEH